LPNILIKFVHGLGDVVQLGVILKHLKRHRPDWVIDVRAGRGKHSALHGLCRRVYHDQEADPLGPYHTTFSLGWFENYNRYADRPCSKVTNCLKEVFGLDWEADLGRYQICVGDRAYVRAMKWMDAAGVKVMADSLSARAKAVVLHYEGNTSTGKKNLTHDEAKIICDMAIRAGRKVILLDWDRRSPLPDDRDILCPRCGHDDIWGGFGSGDAETIAALIGMCEAFIGIDSGPGKVASATTTPSLICWKGHHPLQFHDPAENTLHLIPANWRDQPPVSGDLARAEFFKKHYRFVDYPPESGPASMARAWLARELNFEVKMETRPQAAGLVEHRGFFCHTGLEDQDYVVIRDVYTLDAYRTALMPIRGEGEIVVDVGAHIGTFARKWREKNPLARIICVEACPENIEALRANVGEFATIMQAACTYEKRPMALLNAVTASLGISTGGSCVVPQEEARECWDPQYHPDERPLRMITLHEIMEEFGLERIDVLKLDCEGSEFSILENAPLEKIEFIVCESHGATRWRDLLARRFRNFDVGHMSAHGDFENWHLKNMHKRYETPWTR
jgi:FkbM family methyltransferase